MTLQCQHCGAELIGRAKRFCCDEHRWLYHRTRNYATMRYENDRRTQEMFAEDGVTRKLTGKGCREKGARNELAVCHMIKDIAGDTVVRNLDQTRDGGADVHWGPFAFEVKARQTVSMPAWQAQVREAVKGTDNIPSIVWKRNGEEFWVAMPFGDFLKLFTEMRDALRALSNAPAQ